MARVPSTLRDHRRGMLQPRRPVDVNVTGDDHLSAGRHHGHIGRVPYAPDDDFVRDRLSGNDRQHVALDLERVFDEPGLPGAHVKRPSLEDDDVASGRLRPLDIDRLAQHPRLNLADDLDEPLEVLLEERELGRACRTVHLAPRAAPGIKHIPVPFVPARPANDRARLLVDDEDVRAHLAGDQSGAKPEDALDQGVLVAAGLRLRRERDSRGDRVDGGLDDDGHPQL